MVAVDTDTIVSNNRFRKAWVRHVYEHPQPVPEGLRSNTGSATYLTLVMLHYVDCNARTIASPQIIFYAADGSLAGSYTQKFDAADLVDVAPGTFGQMTLDFICKQPFSGR